MSEIPPKSPDEQMDEIINHPGFHDDFLPKDDSFHPEYAAKKAKGMIDGMNFGLRATAKMAEAEKQRADEAEYRANHDPLTGLLNKSAWKNELEERIAQSSEESLGILFIDLKDFKRANDEKGHDYGDGILTTTADILRATLRTKGEHADSVSFESTEERKKAGRLGGDEFAVIVDLTPRTSDSLTAEERLSIVRDRIRSAFLENQEIKASGVGMSVGQAIWEGQPADELIKQADTSMYGDKEEQKAQEGSYR